MLYTTKGKTRKKGNLNVCWNGGFCKVVQGKIKISTNTERENSGHRFSLSILERNPDEHKPSDASQCPTR